MERLAPNGVVGSKLAWRGLTSLSPPPPYRAFGALTFVCCERSQNFPGRLSNEELLGKKHELAAKGKVRQSKSNTGWSIFYVFPTLASKPGRVQGS